MTERSHAGVPSPIEVVGLVACIAPLFVSMASRSYKTVDGLTEFVYRDPLAIGRTAQAKRWLRTGIASMLILGGVGQVLRGIGKVGGSPAPTTEPQRL